MATSSEQASGSRGGVSPLSEALEKNQEAAKEVQKAADDLAVVHAVLETSAAIGRSHDDARRAIAETAHVEQRLTESAEKLEQVNETLQREIPKLA